MLLMFGLFIVLFFLLLIWLLIFVHHTRVLEVSQSVDPEARSFVFFVEELFVFVEYCDGQ